MTKIRVINKEGMLRYSLLAGAIYFSAIAAAHVSGAKFPGLFIYYNIPSHQYQDNIISFLAFGWAAFFYAAAGAPSIIKPLLGASVVALAGVANINLTTDFETIAGKVSLIPFWIEFAILCGYILWLAMLARQQRKRVEKFPGVQL